ncbi:VCBS repeat-containing protein, partial [bacterium]
DGFQDLAVANSGSNDVTVLLGDGLGGFTPAPGSPFGVGTGPASVAVGDFNGDGFQDLAVANSGSNTVYILLGNGTGSFIAGANFPVGTNPRSVAVGDFNGDLIQDLAVANQGSNDVSVVLGP